MTKNVSQRDKRAPAHIQRAIDADAKLRRQCELKPNWPDVDKDKSKRRPLKPIYVLTNPATQFIRDAQARSSTQEAAE